jgi:Mlo family
MAKLRRSPIVIAAVLLAACPFIAAGSGGGGGGEIDMNFMESPVYVVAAVFLFFLVASLAFEYSIHVVIHIFKKKKRYGLVACINGLVLEITLIGFVSLLLTCFEDNIAAICGTLAIKFVLQL